MLEQRTVSGREDSSFFVPLTGVKSGLLYMIFGIFQLTKGIIVVRRYQNEQKNKSCRNHGAWKQTGIIWCNGGICGCGCDPYLRSFIIKTH